VWPHSWAQAGLTPHAAAARLAQDTNFSFENPSYWTSGPYQVQQYIANDRIVLTPMKYYHIHPGPFVSKFIFAFYSAKDAMIAAAGNDQTNVTTDYTYADLPALRAHKSVFTTWVTPSFVEEHLEYNCIDKTVNGKPNPLTDVRVRQALTLAIDKLGLIRSALGLPLSTAKNIVAYTPWTVTPHLVQMFGDTALKGSWDPLAHTYLPYGPQAVKDAQTLLKQAGYGNGFDIDILTTEGNPVRQAEVSVIQKNWSALGVRATLSTVPGSLILADWGRNGPLIHGNFMVSLWAFGQSPDPDGLKTYFESQFIDRRQSQHADIDSNFAGIQNKQIDQGMKKGATSFDPKVRARWYRLVQEQLNKGAYWVPLYYRANIVTSDHHVSGDTPYPAPSYFGNTWNPWAWKYASS
jgi:ABC-type transport system substrate-binding protein